MPHPRYLTKSRFKTALECETKLFYVNKKKVYADAKLDDEFLQALAAGGFQVGELAKFRFCDDPYGQKITVESLDYEKSLEETQKRLKAPGTVVIAEAAFLFDNFFVRCDIVVKKKNILYLYEVKSKSWERDKPLLKTDKSGVVKGIDGNIRDYVYDIAFQKWVVQNALKEQGLTVKSFLLVVDKESVASVEGLNQCFKIVNEGDRSKAVPKEGLTKNDLGNDILVDIDTDTAADWIFNNPYERATGDMMPFEDYVRFLSENYKNDKRIDTPVGSGCRGCEFDADPEEMKNGMKSGFRECWKRLAKFKDTDFNKPLTLDLWSRGFTKKNDLIVSRKYFLENLCETDIQPKKESAATKSGLSPLARRMLQIDKAKNNDSTPFLDKKGLKAEMAGWKYPLHFIDFETCTSALPFHKDRTPYEGIAFQFSHHTVSENGDIAHAGQFISFEPGVFPNYDFLRELKRQLSADDGSVFRYHNHENTFLNIIRRQLARETARSVKDKDELMAFVTSIAHPTKDTANPWNTPSRDMIDLYDIVMRYYYPPSANGSISIKAILPAVIHDSPFLRKKYREPVYGKKGGIPSLNFNGKVWLTKESEMNPYKTLPPVFEEYDQEKLDSMISDMEEIKEGGTAQKAYEKLQFCKIPVEQRVLIRDALLKYCELDTLAMVMIWEYFKSEIDI